MVFVLPPVILLIVYLVSTPPNTSAADFGGEGGIYQTIFGNFFLGLLATTLGSLLVMAVVIAPLAWLLSGLLPAERAAENVDPGSISRIEYICGGLIVLAAVTFGIAMAFVGGSSAASGNQRMVSQLLALITFQGAWEPALVAVLCVVVLVALVIINNRAVSRRRRAARAMRSVES